MKKFLAILLIAIVACSTVSADEEGKKFDLEKLPENIKNALNTISKPFKKIFQFLKNSGFWDPIANFLKTTGLVVPKELCLKVFDEEFCDELLSGLLQKAGDGEVVLKFPWVVVIAGVKYFVEAVSFAEAVLTVLRWLGLAK